VNVDASSNDRSQTALHFATNFDILNALLGAGSQTDAKDSQGRTVLHYAASRGSVDVIQLLLMRGANVNAVDDFGKPALHFAIANSQAEVRRVGGKGNGCKRRT